MRRRWAGSARLTRAPPAKKTLFRRRDSRDRRRDLLGRAPSARAMRPVGGDEESDIRRRVEQLANLILQHAVGVGDPLAQVPKLEPGLDQERFDEAPGIGRV